MAYVLSVGSSTGSYLSSMEVFIPLSSVTAGANGSLRFDIQLDRGQDHYLALRAYDSTWYSPYSNEIRVAALGASLTSLVSGGATGTSSAASGSSLSRAAASLSQSGATTPLDPSAPTIDPQAGAAALSGSLDLDGATEYLASSAAAPLDAASGVSLSLWGKVPLADSGRRALLRLANGSGAGASGIELYLVNGPDGRALELRVFDAARALDAAHATPLPIEADAWWHLALVVETQARTATLYLDGEPLLTTGDLEIPGALSAGSYFVALGAADPARSQPWLGGLGHAALWNAPLEAEDIAEISLYGHALDLRSDVGEYLGADALVHYWRVGADGNAVGFDAGPAPLDLDDPYGNVDVDDVVADGPESLAPQVATASAQPN